MQDNSEGAIIMFTKEELKDIVKSKLGDSLFVVVSNGEPYVHNYLGGEIACTRHINGMNIALDSVMQACGGTWIASGRGDADRDVVDEKDRVQVPVEDPKYTLKRVWLNKEEENGYYYGSANKMLFPLCMIVYVRPMFKESDWVQYRKVNQRFAEAILEEIGSKKAFVWFQDYHMSLVPKIIKEKRPDLFLGHFWHIPWASPEAFKTCPWKEEILEGLLGNDIIGFPTRYHCNNFLDTIDQTLEAKTDRGTYSISYKGSVTLVKPFPISTDFEWISNVSKTQEIDAMVAQIKRKYDLNNKILAVGVDRVDYTKGIPERLLAIDRFLEKYPEYQKKFVFLQLGTPSKVHIEEYKRVGDQIDSLVEEINWKYKVGNWSPIIFWEDYHERERVMACYKIADVCIVSSLHDGMNLVSKEFVSAQNDARGMLILSRFCGSAKELQEAIFINPYDTERFADAIKEGVEMPTDERKTRMDKMRETVRENNIYSWAGNFVSTLTKLS